VELQQTLYEKKGKLAYVTMNRPERLNAYDNSTVLEWWEIWQDFQKDDNLLVAILSGNGRAFCAGHDIKDMDPGPEPPSLHYGGVEVSKPIIAAIHGYCLGGGCSMALGCDIRLCSEDALFGYPQPAYGMMSIGGHQRLPRMTFPGMALYYMLTGEYINAQEAYRLGLVVKVLPNREELMAEATRLAERLCRNAPLSVRFTKEAFSRGQQTSLREGLHIAQLLFKRLSETEDWQEGLKAFAEKRQPEWKGR
jgi:enoyl-CoA hydratase/carnithine racemase